MACPLSQQQIEQFVVNCINSVKPITSTLYSSTRLSDLGIDGIDINSVLSCVTQTIEANGCTVTTGNIPATGDTTLGEIIAAFYGHLAGASDSVASAMEAMAKRAVSAPPSIVTSPPSDAVTTAYVRGYRDGTADMADRLLQPRVLPVPLAATGAAKGGAAKGGAAKGSSSGRKP